MLQSIILKKDLEVLWLGLPLYRGIVVNVLNFVGFVAKLGDVIKSWGRHHTAAESGQRAVRAVNDVGFRPNQSLVLRLSNRRTNF